MILADQCVFKTSYEDTLCSNCDNKISKHCKEVDGQKATGERLAKNPEHLTPKDPKSSTTYLVYLKDLRDGSHGGETPGLTRSLL